jgi:hypothetical protein
MSGGSTTIPPLLKPWNSVSVGPPLDGDHNVLVKEEDRRCQSSSHQSDKNILWVNHSVPTWPREQVQVRYSFVSFPEERSALQQMAPADAEYSRWEGFDGPRRRVQYYSLDAETTSSESLPMVLQQIRQRILEQTGFRARSVKLEDYVPVRYPHASSWKYDPQIISACAVPMNTEPSSLDTFVAEIILPMSSFKADPKLCHPSLTEDSIFLENMNHDVANSFLIQNWNLPRDHEKGFHLQSEHHSTYVRLPYYTLLLRANDMVSAWRNSRFLWCHPEVPPPRIRVIQFYSHPPHSTKTPTHLPLERSPVDRFGYVRTPNEALLEEARQSSEPPPLSELLTIVITTSPIKSHPSTEVIESAMATFLLAGGSNFAYSCRKIIVCDGYRTYVSDAKDDDPTTTVSRRQNDKQSMRNGIVTPQQAENYAQYKERLQTLCENATTTSAFQNTNIIELPDRHGYGYALKHVVTHHVTTPYVCVIQHDRTFVRPTPISETVHAMWRHLAIKYVGFSMRSNLLYRDIFLAKYGKQYQSEWDDMILRVPELQVPRTEYGPQSASTQALQVKNEVVRQNILLLAETYRGSAQATVVRSGTTPDDRHQISLVPTLYWYDNIHICETQQYRDFVFDAKFKMCARGGFVEDKLSPVLKRTVERLGLRLGHERFGCYLLDDHSGMFFTGHLDGGSYLSAEERAALPLVPSSSDKTSIANDGVTCQPTTFSNEKEGTVEQVT